jgi:tRNA U34 2-thiouridine synthase MnmA/TrmU
MKALCLFSGGLDSMLAASLIRAQDISVLALFFETPFFSSKKARESAQYMDLPFKVVNITKRHLEIVRRPKYGYGGNMNPCIDCHALMFRIAGEMLEKEEASFVVSGEVLGQRPMSQNKKSLSLISAESELDGLLLRPLSAKHLPLTIPEEMEWVKRELLMDFQGRSRKLQMDLAVRLNIEKYPSPAGGCLLADKAFSQRLKDLFSSQNDFEPREIELLKLGRHFRIASNTKLVVGRNKGENEEIRALSGERNLILTSDSGPGPVVLMLGDLSQELLELAAAITMAYSDIDDCDSSAVRVIGRDEDRILTTKVHDKEEFRHYMI